MIIRNKLEPNPNLSPALRGGKHKKCLNQILKTCYLIQKMRIGILATKPAQGAGRGIQIWFQFIFSFVYIMSTRHDWNNKPSTICALMVPRIVEEKNQLLVIIVFGWHADNAIEMVRLLHFYVVLLKNTKAADTRYLHDDRLSHFFASFSLFASFQLLSCLWYSFIWYGF